jgi:hypothetical protein
MKIQGVLLATVEEQGRGGDRDPLDPASVTTEIDPQRPIPVRVDFSALMPAGEVTKLWIEEGRLMFEAEIVDPEKVTYANGRFKYPGTAAAGVKIGGVEEGGEAQPHNPILDWVDQ